MPAIETLPVPATPSLCDAITMARKALAEVDGVRHVTRHTAEGMLGYMVGSTEVATRAAAAYNALALHHPFVQ